MTEQEIKIWIDHTIKEYIKIWNDSSDLKIFSIQNRFDVRGHVAGYFCYNPNDIYFRWNLEIAMNNYPDYKQTIGHEVAHLIVHQIDCKNGCRSKSHGARWNAVMLTLGLEPKRCHNYKTTAVRNSNYITRFVCPQCGLSEKITLQRYKNMLKTIEASGKVNYFCKCRHQLNLADDCKPI